MTEEVHFWKIVRDEGGQIKTGAWLTPIHRH